MNFISNNSTRINYYCNECDEDKVMKDNDNNTKICIICGNNLIERSIDIINEDSQNQRRPTNESLQSILELIGADLHQAILESMSLSAPTRQINMDYLQSLGKVQIDLQKIILRDSYINIGPLQILAVASSFSWIPNDIYQLSGSLVLGNPIFGNSIFLNKEECKDSIIILERGEVSFARKAIHAIQCNASAVVIIQTNGVWPFIMTDNSNEIINNHININIPIIMISKSDGDLIKKLILDNKSSKQNKQIQQQQQEAITTSTNHNSIQGLLKFGHNVTECSICQEIFEYEQIVYKLPCRHVYHVGCVTSWLQQSNTCPLCRLELPKEDNINKKLNTTTNNRSNPNDLTRTYYN